MKRPMWVVIVMRGEYPQVYGPYRSFRAAEADAAMYGGSVEPVRPQLSEVSHD